MGLVPLSRWGGSMSNILQTWVGVPLKKKTHGAYEAKLAMSPWRLSRVAPCVPRASLRHCQLHPGSVGTKYPRQSLGAPVATLHLQA